MITVRAAGAYDGDTAFVRSSWLHHARSTKAHHVPTTIFYDGIKPLVSSLMHRSIILLAVSAEQPDTILGAVVGEPALEARHYCLIHWCYVKAPFRKHGIASQLVSDLRALGESQARLAVTCHLETEDQTIRTKKRGAVVCPSLSYFIALKGLPCPQPSP